VNWRPLSLRGKADARFDEPSEGLPTWLRAPVLEWVKDSFSTQAGWVLTDALTSLQLAFRLEPPLHGTAEWDLLADLLARIGEDDEFGLDVLDWMLHEWRQFESYPSDAAEWATKLGNRLSQGGSAWEVTANDDRFQLSRRAVGPVVQVLEQTATEATRAHSHLAAAWTKLMGRGPDPSSAYRESIRAVEAVAKPVVLPNNDRATLGQMIAALKDKPEKWTATLGTVDDLRAQMEAVWRGQLDRHGTDDETVPLNVSQDEADAAFSTCLNLVRLFAGGHVRQAASPS
jgi:hypothetical protein